MPDRAFIDYGLQDFISKKSNVLFITGYMGSGKSTLANSLAEKYHAVAITLDVVFEWNDTSTSFNRYKPYVKKFLELLEHAGMYTKFDDVSGTFSKEWRMATASERCEILIKQAIKDVGPGNRIILEGVQLYHYPVLFNLYIKYPLLIMSTSASGSKASDAARDLSNGRNFFRVFADRKYKNYYYNRQLSLFEDYCQKVKSIKGGNTK